MSQLAPRLLNYFRRAHAFRDGLEIESRCYLACFPVCAATISEPQRRVELRVSMARVPRIISMNLCFDLCAGLIGVIPQERVRHFYTTIPAEKLGCLLVGMPNIECLWFDNVIMSEGFLQPKSDGPHASKELLPSLRVLCLTSSRPPVNSGDPSRRSWSIRLLTGSPFRSELGVRTPICARTRRRRWRILLKSLNANRSWKQSVLLVVVV